MWAVSTEHIITKRQSLSFNCKSTYEARQSSTPSFLLQVMLGQEIDNGLARAPEAGML